MWFGCLQPPNPMSSSSTCGLVKRTAWTYCARSDPDPTCPSSLPRVTDATKSIAREDWNAVQREAEQGRYRFGNWQLDRRLRRLTTSSGTPVVLTKGEYSLLTAFLDAPQRPLTREHLLQATRVHEDVFDRSIDVQILRLRRKLETDSRAPSIIQTERGVGYTFALPVERLSQ